MLSEIEDLARRLEQQLKSYEKLHADEMKAFQAQLETFQRIQADELKSLQDELKQLKEEIAALKEQEAKRASESPPPEAAFNQFEKTISRRDFLTGNIPPFNQRRTSS